MMTCRSSSLFSCLLLTVCFGSISSLLQPCGEYEFHRTGVCLGEDWSVSNGTQWADGTIVNGWGYTLAYTDSGIWNDPFLNVTKGLGLMAMWDDNYISVDHRPATGNYSTWEGYLKTMHRMNEEACYRNCDPESDCYTTDYTTDYSKYIGHISAKYNRMCTVNYTCTKPIYMASFSGLMGSLSPDYLLNEGVELAGTALNRWCQEPEQSSWCNITSSYNEDGREIFEYVGDNSMARFFDYFFSEYNDYEITNGVYAWWSDEYLANLFEFQKTLNIFLKNMDRFHTVSLTSLNAEAGEISKYVRIGFLNYTQMDRVWQKLVNQTIQLDMDPKMWTANVAMGGRYYRDLVRNAGEHGMGISTHGPWGTISQSFIQHLPDIEYDPVLKTYVETGLDRPFTQLHSDLSLFHNADNTYGQYRVFRLASMAALSLRATSLLVPAYTIASKGASQESCADETSNSHEIQLSAIDAEEDPSKPSLNAFSGRCSFNWSICVEIGCDKFLDWMNFVVSDGRPATKASEAFVMMSEYGTEIPDEVDWKTAWADYQEIFEGYFPIRLVVMICV